jgi:hypothetical protein
MTRSTHLPLAGALLALALPALAGAQEKPAARPQPGRWAGVVGNGYKGDSVLFTVGPDGAQLRDVTFAGYWRCADGSMSGSLESTRTGPPAPVPVRAGTFADKQTRPSWWWNVDGRFTSATTAEGTYRAAANGASCDTRVLRWTARRIGD